MFRKLTLAAILFAPFPALASEGQGTLIIGGAAVVVVVCAALVANVGTRVFGIPAAALAGIVVAGYLAAQHNSPSASVCNINDVFNCDLVNRSTYSQIGAVPIALLGVAFYAVIAWLSLRNTSGGAPKAPAAMTGLAALAVAYDLFLLWASVDLGAYCPLCMVSWALNVVILVGAALRWRATEAISANALVAGFSTEGGSIAIVGLMTLILGWFASAPSGSTAAAVGSGGSAALANAYEQVAGKIELDGTEPSTGPVDARFTIVEYADYECPHCALMADELKKVLADNPDVRLLYKHYPISGICNQFVDREGHKNACNAAAAAECARLQGKFWELNRQMFKNQEFLGKDDLRFMVEQQGIDMAAFETCMADPSTAEAVKQDVAAGGVAGINGTPSVFIKGLFGDQWVRLTGDHAQMSAVIAAAREGKPLPPAPPPAEM